ncbi:hypothetical protein ACFRFL_20620 [Streptomyces sp. NPDC056708]|uniref:hypothetical protein n=1 Tax=unclassified Streptomyces TaxID=2593676 RepID=UPI00369F3060
MEAVAGEGEEGCADRLEERRTVVAVQYSRTLRVVELTGAAAAFTDPLGVPWPFRPRSPTDGGPARPGTPSPPGRPYTDCATPPSVIRW